MEYASPKKLDIAFGDTVEVKFEDWDNSKSPRRKTKAIVRITDKYGSSKEHILISSDGHHWFEFKTGNVVVGQLSCNINQVYEAWITGAFE